MDTDLQQTEHLQISFSPTDQDRRYAGKRLLRYIEPAWRRKYWFGSAAFLLVWGSLFVFACWLLNGINNTYIQFKTAICLPIRKLTVWSTVCIKLGTTAAPYG